MFKPGDVLLYEAPAWKFSNLIPKIIRLITGNKITHVALYLGTNDKGHVILDALSRGTELKTMQEPELYDRHKDDFKLYGVASLQEIKIDSSNVVFMYAAAKYSKTPYGFKTIFNLLLQHGMGRVFKKEWTLWFKSNKGYICSEVTQLVLEDVLRLNQINPPFTKVASLTEPDDYLSAPWKVTIITKN